MLLKIINRHLHLTNMKKGISLENKQEVFDYLTAQKIDYKIYNHSSAKTVQDIIGKINQTLSANSRKHPL